MYEIIIPNLVHTTHSVQRQWWCSIYLHIPANMSTSSSVHPSRKDIPNFLTPSSAFSGEKLRGVISSVVSGGVSGMLNLVGATAMGLSAPLSAFFFLYLFGSIFGYSADIVFAKKNFTIKRGYKGEKPYSGPVPYSDFGTRILWLLSSFIDRYFFRFVITVIIDTLIGIAILHALIDYTNNEDFLTNFAYRDILLAGGVSIFTFFLYNNVLRFDWAYSDSDSPLMNVMVLMWVGLALLVYAMAYSASTSRKNNSNNKQGSEDGAKKNNTNNIFYTPVAEQDRNKSPSDFLFRGNDKNEDDSDNITDDDKEEKEHERQVRAYRYE